MGNLEISVLKLCIYYNGLIFEPMVRYGNANRDFQDFVSIDKNVKY